MNIETNRKDKTKMTSNNYEDYNYQMKSDIDFFEAISECLKQNNIDFADAHIDPQKSYE